MDAARLALAKAELEVGIDPELAKLGARLDMADGDFIGAVDRLQAHPLDGEGQRLLAAASLRSGAADVAVALYQGLLGDAPEDEALWVGLALALEGAGGSQAALRVAYEHLAEAGSDINVRRFAWERLVAMG